MNHSRKVSPSSKTKFNMAHENMLWAVVMFSLSVANVGITMTVANFYSLMQFLQSNLNTIETLRFVVDMPITGFAAQKKTVKGALVVVSAQIMYSTYSYAIANNLPVLANQMLISPSALRKMGYLRLLQYLGGALQIVTPLATAGTLASVNVTPSLVAAWQALWDQLQAMLADPKNAIANRVALNASIYQLLHDCMYGLTNEGDTLVYAFQAGNLDYFNSYWSNRKLNEHHRHTQLRAHTADELNQPVRDIVVEVVVDENDPSKNVKGVTNERGYCVVGIIPFGEHKVLVDGVEYGPFRFKKGQSLTKHFTVLPAFAPKPVKTVAKAKVK